MPTPPVRPRDFIGVAKALVEIANAAADREGKNTRSPGALE
jgi:hypothetical protein